MLRRQPDPSISLSTKKMKPEVTRKPTQRHMGVSGLHKGGMVSGVGRGSILGILAVKGSDVWSTKPDATVFEALRTMASRDVGALLVVESNVLIGIMSERDYARKIILVDRASRQTAVRQIMTPDPICVRPETTIDQALVLMTSRKIRHLPVLDVDAVVGIVSLGDVIQAKLEEQELELEQLRAAVIAS
jgi:CBS domain-containing protein